MLVPNICYTSVPDLRQKPNALITSHGVELKTKALFAAVAALVAYTLGFAAPELANATMAKLTILGYLALSTVSGTAFMDFLTNGKSVESWQEPRPQAALDTRLMAKQAGSNLALPFFRSNVRLCPGHD